MLSRMLSIFLVFAIGTTVFIGFLAINFMSHGNHFLCPISSMMNGSCSSLGAIEMAIHHLSGLKSFTLGIVNINNIFLLAFALLLFLNYLIFAKTTEKNISKQLSFYKKYVKEPVGELKSDILYWLSLHNKRDPYSIYNRCTIFN